MSLASYTLFHLDFECTRVLNENNVEEYISFVDKIVYAYLPNKNENADLHELVKLYQIQRHSKTCRKQRNDGCRFHFRKFFSNQTKFAKPLPSDMPENMKHSLLSERKDILSKVKDYINNYLNLAKVNFQNLSRDTFENLKSVSEILEELNITEEEYMSALQISDDLDFQLHLKRPTDSYFVNNFQAITYMCSYLSKEEGECSQAMKQAFKEILENAAGYYE